MTEEKKERKPRENKSEKILNMMKMGLSLDLLDKKCFTLGVCKELLKKYPNCLKSIPKDSRSESVCLTAIEVNENNLEFVPKELKSQEFYKKCCKKNPKCLSLVPKQFLTPEMKKAIGSNYLGKVRNAKDKIAEFEKVPVKDRTEAMCDECLKANSDNLTNEFYLKLINIYPMVIEKIEKTKITKEMYELAFSLDATALKCLPTEMITQEMCYKFISVNPTMMKIVPENFRTKCKMNKIPEEYKSARLCSYYLRKLGKQIKDENSKNKYFENFPKDFQDLIKTSQEKFQNGFSFLSN